ncbi:microviridin/marinostatin family tricyclic proteinase inhibitor [Myxococcota bacterium]|nr:microviridin/marinostatin family tricyclic proteinase inhibitor [Myxococcota bacterium]
MKPPTRVPFFARFVQQAPPTLSTEVRAGWGLPGQRFETMKHPSDSDEGGLVERVRVTLKPTGDRDE